MAVVSKLQHVVESVSRERDQVLSLFQAPVAVAPAAYHRDISMHSQPSEYDQYNDDVTAYMLRGGSRATSHDGRHSREQEHASAPHGYAAKASPRRAPPTPPRSHHVQRHVDYDVFQV